MLWRVGIRRLGWGPAPKLTVPENSGATGTRGPNPGFCPVHLVWLPSPSWDLERQEAHRPRRTLLATVAGWINMDKWTGLSRQLPCQTV